MNTINLKHKKDGYKTSEFSLKINGVNVDVCGYSITESIKGPTKITITMNADPNTSVFDISQIGNSMQEINRVFN